MVKNEPIAWASRRGATRERLINHLQAASARDSVSRDFYTAALSAMLAAEQDGLTPSASAYGEHRYTVQQGLKAACHSREDTAATLLIQERLLVRLQNLRVLAWACVTLLLYIALRIT